MLNVTGISVRNNVLKAAQEWTVNAYYTRTNSKRKAPPPPPPLFPSTTRTTQSNTHRPTPPLPHSNSSTLYQDRHADITHTHTLCARAHTHTLWPRVCAHTHTRTHARARARAHTHTQSIRSSMKTAGGTTEPKQQGENRWLFHCLLDSILFCRAVLEDSQAGTPNQ